MLFHEVNNISYRNEPNGTEEFFSENQMGSLAVVSLMIDSDIYWWKYLFMLSYI